MEDGNKLNNRETADKIKKLIDGYGHWWENTANDFLNEKGLKTIDDTTLDEAMKFFTIDERKELVKKLAKYRKLVKLMADIEINKIKMLMMDIR